MTGPVADTTHDYPAATLKPGDKAPDFTLLDQNVEPFKLSKSIKDRKVRHWIHFCPGA